MIDRGRAGVAAVEEAAFGGTTFDDVVDRDALEGRLRHVVTGHWWSTCGPRVEVVMARAGTRSSTAREGGSVVEVRLADEQLTLATAAHELAHALAGVDAGHGPRFRAAHVDVTAVLGGRAISEALAVAYRAFGLGVAGRTWLEPYRAEGDGFRITT